MGLWGCYEWGWNLLRRYAFANWFSKNWYWVKRTMHSPWHPGHPNIQTSRLSPPKLIPLGPHVFPPFAPLCPPLLTIVLHKFFFFFLFFSFCWLAKCKILTCLSIGREDEHGDEHEDEEEGTTFPLSLLFVLIYVPGAFLSYSPRQTPLFPGSPVSVFSGFWSCFGDSFRVLSQNFTHSPRVQSSSVFIQT